MPPILKTSVLEADDEPHALTLHTVVQFSNDDFLVIYCNIPPKRPREMCCRLPLHYTACKKLYSVLKSTTNNGCTSRHRTSRLVSQTAPLRRQVNGKQAKRKGQSVLWPPPQHPDMAYP